MNDAPRIEDLLTVGRKVRVQLNPECPWYDKTRMGSEVSTDGPIPQTDGATGEIRRVPRHLARFHTLDHPFFVRFAPPPSIAGTALAKQSGFETVAAGYYAASELIPLTETGEEILHPALARFER